MTDDFPSGVAVMLRESELELHRESIRGRLSVALPKAALFFASSIADIASPEKIDALITPVQPWVDEVVLKATNLKWIHFLSAGIDGIWDLGFDKERYLITKSSGVHAIPMAEYVVGSILYFLKDFHVFHRQQRNREWKRRWLDESTGKTVAILGLGAIGREIAKRCNQMGMTVLGMATTSRIVDHVDRVVKPADMSEILRKADFVVVCIPLTPETRGLLDANALASIKPGAYMVDISRGGVVDQTALATLLREGHLAGAALDVFETEPLPETSELWSLHNVLITPHVSGTTPFYMDRAIQVFLKNRETLIESGALWTPVYVQRMY